MLMAVAPIIMSVHSGDRIFNWYMKGKQDKGEFADLGEAKREYHVLVESQAADLSRKYKDQKFNGNDTADEGQDRQGVMKDQMEVDGGPDSNEKKTQQ